MKLYDRVLALLREYPVLRDSDKKLIWAVWTKQNLVQEIDGVGIVQTGAPIKVIEKHAFYSAPTPESITRARRKIQELHPELRSSAAVQEQKDEKERQKGTFIFRENAFQVKKDEEWAG